VCRYVTISPPGPGALDDGPVPHGSWPEAGPDVVPAVSRMAAVYALPSVYVPAGLRRLRARLTEAVESLDSALGLADDVALQADTGVALQRLGRHAEAIAKAALAPGLPEPAEPPFTRSVDLDALGDRTGEVRDCAEHLRVADGGCSPHEAELTAVMAKPPDLPCQVWP
jgi:hypothetical protein